MALETVLRKNFTFVLAGLGLCGAFFTARTLSQGLGLALAADEKQLSAAPLVIPPSGSVASPSRHSTSAEAILASNPFDSITGPLREAPPVPVASGAEIDYSDPRSAPACDGVKVLVITAATDPDWSFAAFSDGGPGKTTLARRGQEVGGKKLIFVGWDRVWLQNGSQLCQASLFASPDAPKPPPAMAEATPAAMPGKGPPTLSADLAKGIRRLGATEFEIDRGVVDKILENQSELMRSARIQPEQENGKVVGIKLLNIRPDTLLGTLGMENGDRLQQINGFDMTSPEKALEAYARLRTADKLTVQVTRRGQLTNLDYNIK